MCDSMVGDDVGDSRTRSADIRSVDWVGLRIGREGVGKGVEKG